MVVGEGTTVEAQWSQGRPGAGVRDDQNGKWGAGSRERGAGELDRREREPHIVQGPRKEPQIAASWVHQSVGYA